MTDRFNPGTLKSKATGKRKEFAKVAGKLLKMKRGEVDRLVHDMHDHEFSETDCLECANCCKTLGPRLTHQDIEKMAGMLKTDTSALFERYIKVDEEGDYVFCRMPCPFLEKDNYCQIYEARPGACRTYPHTDRKNIQGIIHLCLKNTEVCPVVYNIFDRLSRFGF